jgi:hypothetical protein
MGYTHYFTTANQITKEQMDELGLFVQKAIKIFEEETGHKIKGPMGDCEPIITSKEIAFNGDEESKMSHETMAIYSNDNNQAFSFCKTARKPYDALVVATILEAKKLGILKSWSSDGDEEDLVEAKQFYNMVCDS